MLTVGVFLFGLLLGRHDFNQAWFSASMTLFIVAAVLLVLVVFDQRKAITAIDKALAVGEARSPGRGARERGRRRACGRARWGGVRCRYGRCRDGARHGRPGERHRTRGRAGWHAAGDGRPAGAERAPRCARARARTRARVPPAARRGSHGRCGGRVCGRCPSRLGGAGPDRHHGRRDHRDLAGDPGPDGLARLIVTGVPGRGTPGRGAFCTRLGGCARFRPGIEQNGSAMRQLIRRGLAAGMAVAMAALRVCRWRRCIPRSATWRGSRRTTHGSSA